MIVIQTPDEVGIRQLIFEGNTTLLIDQLPEGYKMVFVCDAVERIKHAEIATRDVTDFQKVPQNSPIYLSTANSLQEKLKET